MTRRLRSLIVWFLTRWHDLKQKQIAAAARMGEKKVSRLLRRGEIEDDDYEALLSAVARRPAEAEIVAGCLEDLESLKEAEDLTPDSRWRSREGSGRRRACCVAF